LSNKLIVTFCLLCACFQISAQECERAIIDKINVAENLLNASDSRCTDTAKLALKQSEVCSDSIQQSVRYCLVRGFYQLGKLDSTLHYSLDLFKFAQRTNDLRFLSRGAEFLYVVYNDLHQKDLAEEYLHLSEKSAFEARDTLQWLMTRINRLNYYVDTSLNYAVADYKDIIQLSSNNAEFGSVYKKATMNLATIYSMLGQFDSSVAIYNRLINDNVFEDDSRSLYYVHFNLGINKYDLGDPDQGILEIKASRAYLDTNELTLLIETDDLLSRFYEEQGQLDSALEYIWSATMLKDKLYKVNSAEEIARLREEFEAEQRELEIENLTLEKEAESFQKQLSIIIALALGIFVFLGFVSYRSRIAKQKLETQSRIERLEKEKEVLSLQTMLFAQEEERQRIARDLHDSIGALLSTAKLHMSNIEEEVRSLSNLNFFGKTREIIENASKEVRRVAHDMMPSVLMKLGLEEGLEDFFEKVRATEKIIVNFTYDELHTRLENQKEVMLYRMIQEMVSNTLKHAQASEIKLMMKVFDHQLIIDYKDDGIGFDAKQWENESNFGLTGLQSRAKFIGASLALESAPNEGVHITISLPLD
jgi:two-component system NarL family sensor kinase